MCRFLTWGAALLACLGQRYGEHPRNERADAGCWRIFYSLVRRFIDAARLRPVVHAERESF